jgi:hypothetical protein
MALFKLWMLTITFSATLLHLVVEALPSIWIQLQIQLQIHLRIQLQILLRIQLQILLRILPQILLQIPLQQACRLLVLGTWKIVRLQTIVAQAKSVVGYLQIQQFLGPVGGWSAVKIRVTLNWLVWDTAVVVLVPDVRRTVAWIDESCEENRPWHHLNCRMTLVLLR